MSSRGAKQPNWIRELKRLGAIIFIVFYISGAGRFLSQFHIPILDDYLTATERTRYINLDVQEVQAQEPTLTPSPTPSNYEVLKGAGIENTQSSEQEAGYIPQVIKEVFGDKAEEAGRVAFCESSHNPKAKSRYSTAKGLFQIIDGTWELFDCTGDPLNAYDNAQCAKRIYDHAGGWSTSGGWAASYQCHQLR